MITGSALSASQAKNPAITAFRVVDIPSSNKFLLIWAAPGDSQLKLTEVTPTTDQAFTIKSLGTVASNFIGHGIGDEFDNSGGLSEIVIDPAETRYSMAYEGAGALYLLTAPLPKP